MKCKLLACSSVTLALALILGIGARAQKAKPAEGKSEAARIEAKRILGGAANGSDPADTRAARRREMTVADLLKLYEMKGCVIQRGFRQGQPMKPMTKRQTLSRLWNHVGPLLGVKKISDVRQKDIDAFEHGFNVLRPDVFGVVVGVE